MHSTANSVQETTSKKAKGLSPIFSPIIISLLLVIFIATSIYFFKKNTTKPQLSIEKIEKIKKKIQGKEILSLEEVTFLKGLAHGGDRQAIEVVSGIETKKIKELKINKLEDLVGVIFEKPSTIMFSVKIVCCDLGAETSSPKEEGGTCFVYGSEIICAKIEKLWDSRYYLHNISKFDYKSKLFDDSGRFVFVKSSNYGEVFVGANTEAHNELVRLWQRKGGVVVSAGGFYKIDPKQKRIHLYGESVQYGKGDHEIARRFLQENLPDEYKGYTIIIE